MRRGHAAQGEARWGRFPLALGLCVCALALWFAPAASAVQPYLGETMTGRITQTVHSVSHSVHGGDGYEDFTYTVSFVMKFAESTYTGFDADYMAISNARWTIEGYEPNSLNIDRNCSWSGSGDDPNVRGTITYGMAGSDRGRYTIETGSSNDPTPTVKMQCTLDPQEVYAVVMPQITVEGTSLTPQLKGTEEYVTGTPPYTTTMTTGWNFTGSFRDHWKTAQVRRRAGQAANFMDHMMDASGVVGAVAGITPGGQSVALACAGLAASSFLSRELFEWIRDDPPDRNYMQIAKPTKPLSVTFRAGAGSSTAQARALTTYTRAVAELQSYLRAFTTSYERAAGVDWNAPNAGDWWNRQQSAAASYARAAASRFDQLEGLRRKLSAALGDKARTKLTSKLITRARDQARHRGLPASVAAALRKLGWSAAQVAALRSSVSRASAKGTPSMPARLLADPTLASYEHDLAAGMRSYPELP